MSRKQSDSKDFVCLWPWQKWFYDETSNQLKNGFGKCLMAPHAGGIRKAKISFTRFGSGENRACRGSSWQDNDKSNYIAFWPVDALETCKDRCRERTSCKGIEFNPDLRRCEVWIKPVTLAVTTVANFSCYTASLEDPTLAIFEDVDGGSERVCRGNNPGDNSLSYFTLSLAESKEDCSGNVQWPQAAAQDLNTTKQGAVNFGPSLLVPVQICLAISVVRSRRSS